MSIDNFSALIELVATMSIAFVAVEYVKSYTKELCEAIFDFSRFIDDTFKKCKDLVSSNLETLNHIKPIDINGKSTNSKIEETKRDHEELLKTIEQTINDKKNKITKECQARSMSSLCFFVFLLNVLLLFVGSVECKHTTFSHIFIFVLCVLSIIYLISGWIWGEKENNVSLFRFNSLKHPIISFIILIFLSIGGSLLIFGEHWSFIEAIWWYILMAFILLSYINFVIFVFKIRNNANAFKLRIKNKMEELNKQCENADNDVRDLLSSNRLSEKLKA